MTPRLAAAGAILIWAGTPASAHRLDEYLQAAILSVEKDRVQAAIHLTPGVAVFPIVLADIDTNGDGAISAAEQQAYAERVLGDLALTSNGAALKLRLVSTKFPNTEEMKEGRGEIQIESIADLPRGAAKRRLIFENHHQTQIAAYLVNCLVPRDPNIRLTGQKRNYSQSRYELDYVQAGVDREPLSQWSKVSVWAGSAALLLLATLALLRRQRA